MLSVSQAADFLGVSLRTFKRHLAQGKIVPHSKSPGGHWRFRSEDLESVQQTFAVAQASPILRQKRDRIEELNLRLQERKTNIALRELEDEERQRADRERVSRQEQRDVTRKARLEVERERIRQQHERDQIAAEEQAVHSREEWKAEWLRDTVGWLPRDLPPEWRLAVTEAIRERLEDLYETSSGHAEDLIGVELRAIAEATLRPWRRAKSAEGAACEALQRLPLFARGSFGKASDWERRAKAEALSAIGALSESANLEQMEAIARSAVDRVAQEYEHCEARTRFLTAVVRSLPGRLSTSQERREAEEAVRRAVGALPVGVSITEFEAARDAALAPFIASQSEARAARQAQEAKSRLEAEADSYLYRVPFYLAQLEANPDGWDFEGKRYEYAERIKAEIKPRLVSEMPLDFSAAQQRVLALVDEWLATHVEFT